MRKLIFTMIIISCVFSISSAQEKLNLSLEDVISIASEKSLDAFRNKNMYLASYWEHRYFQADRLPSLNLSATPLDFNRYRKKEYNFQTNEEEFVQREYLNSDVSLSLNQKIGLTGGTLFLSSDMGMIKNLGGDKNTSYQANPINVGFSQTLNGYNELRWKAKIEPLKFEKAKKELIQSKEYLAITTTMKFFNLVEAQIQLSIAETNLANADTLYKIGKGRFQVGTVTQDELLNLELSFLNSKQALNKSQLELQRSQADLNSYLTLDKSTQLRCIIPSQIPAIQIGADQAITKALENNPDILEHIQLLLEQDKNVAKAKSETGLNTSIFALFGLNQSSSNFDDVYSNPDKSQRLSVGVNIPILDWGKRKGRLQMAESTREVERAKIKQARIDFEQNVFQKVMEFNLQSEQVKNAAKADTVAQLGYEVTFQRFLIGKVNVINLNQARNDLSQARIAYVNAVKSYWNYYYSIRMLTLFDFVKNETLSAEYDKILQN